MIVNTHVVKSTAKKVIRRSRKRGYGGKAELQLAWGGDVTGSDFDLM